MEVFALNNSFKTRESASSNLGSERSVCSWGNASAAASVFLLCAMGENTLLFTSFELEEDN